MGEDLVTLVLSLLIGDLGCKVRLGAVEAFMGLTNARTLALGVMVALVRTNDEGFLNMSLVGVPEAAPFGRLAEREGSTFSKSSMSSSSALRLVLDWGVKAVDEVSQGLVPCSRSIDMASPTYHSACSSSSSSSVGDIGQEAQRAGERQKPLLVSEDEIRAGDAVNSIDATRRSLQRSKNKNI